MKPVLKEDPREWRKFALMNALGLTGLASLLRWRHVLPVPGYLGALSVLALLAIAGCVRPQWFRGWYRVATTVGHALVHFLGQVALVIVFLLVLTPLGLVLRLAGKDLLKLRRDPHGLTYWQEARRGSPLDRLF